MNSAPFEHRRKNRSHPFRKATSGADTQRRVCREDGWLHFLSSPICGEEGSSLGRRLGAREGRGSGTRGTGQCAQKRINHTVLSALSLGWWWMMELVSRRALSGPGTQAASFQRGYTCSVRPGRQAPGYPLHVRFLRNL